MSNAPPTILPLPLSFAAKVDYATGDGPISVSSTDVNNDMLSYRWQMIGRPIGSGAVLTSSTAVKPMFNADLTGDYSITLIVNDGMADSAVVTIKVTATAN